MMREAAKIGPATIALVEAIMEAKPHPEQGFRSCLGIISLVRTYGSERVEAASRRGNDIGATTYGSIKSILQNGLDKAYANWIIAKHGKDAVLESLEQKKFGIVFNRFQEQKEIQNCLNQLRDYLDILDKYVKYKNRIHIVGMIPYCKIINITNNRGVLFYAKDRNLSGKMDLIARNVITENRECPTLANDNREILHYLEKNGQTGAAGKLGNTAKKLQVDVPYGREKAEGAEFKGVPFSRG